MVNEQMVDVEMKHIVDVENEAHSSFVEDV